MPAFAEPGLGLDGDRLPASRAKSLQWVVHLIPAVSFVCIGFRFLVNHVGTGGKPST